MVKKEMKSKIVPQKFLYILFNPLYKLLIGGGGGGGACKAFLIKCSNKIKKEREIFSFIEATVLCNFSHFFFSVSLSNRKQRKIAKRRKGFSVVPLCK